MGDWSIVLIGREPVDRSWLPTDLTGKDVLCLASGGGQQGPILAAARTRVTVFDDSPRQLGRDQMVAARGGLEPIHVALFCDARDQARLTQPRRRPRRS